VPFAASADKGMSHQAAVNTKGDCAAMIRSKAEIPKKMSELLTQVADNFEAHAKAMMTNKDKASKQEVSYLMKLAKQQREVALSIHKVATEMASARFEPAPHSAAMMDSSQMKEALSRQAMLEKQVASLLSKDAAGIQKMTASSKGGRAR
jgi:hypothetical protein